MASRGASDRSFRKSLAHGKEQERKTSAYLKALGYRVLPTTDFSSRGAPMLEAADREDSLIMPDAQAFRDGEGAWFENKWKTKAIRGDKSGRLETGISLRHFDHYARVERESRIPVVLVFVHETEREVRCGTLEQLADAFSHDYTGDRMDPGGNRFWFYERIPLWMSLDELNAGLLAHRLGAKLVRPIEPPINGLLLREGHAIRKHVRREPAPKPVFERRSWTWTCLPCNVTGTGPKKHTCLPSAPSYLRDHWIRRITSANPAIGQAEAAALISQPVDRMQLVQWQCSKCGEQAVLSSTPYEGGRPENVLCSTCACPQDGAA